MSKASAGRPVFPVQAAQRKRLYEEIVGQIQDLIEKGQLKTGDQLPPERELAEIFAVSRHSVREAIRALEEKRLLESRPGDGTYVILPEGGSLVEPLARAIQAQKDRLQEVFQFRRLIEPQIAYLAAENATDTDVAEIREILAHQEREIDAGESAIEPDVNFHLCLARTAKNAILLRITEVLNDALRESRAEYVQSRVRQRISLAAHRRVLIALEKRDPEEAKVEMQRHLTETEHAVFGNGEGSMKKT